MNLRNKHAFYDTHICSVKRYSHLTASSVNIKKQK